MNKNLLAAAIAAGLMVPGLAAADVKIFGVIQAETGTVDWDVQGATDEDVTLMGNGGSKNGAIHGGGPNAIGFKGTEKLGNGLTAYFKISSQFDTFDKESTFTGRETFVGIKGKGWHVHFGRDNTLYKTSSHKYDPFVATGLQQRATGGVSNLHNAYWNDMAEIGFKSGNWSGGIQTTWEDASREVGNNSYNASSLGSGTSDNIDAGSWNGRIKYKTKSWEASLSYIDIDFGGTGDGGADALKIAGKWSGNGFTIGAQYENIDVDSSALGVATRPDGGSHFFAPSTQSSAYGLGTINSVADEYDSLALYGSYKLSGNTSIHLTFANADVDTIIAGTDADVTTWAIGATHKFSKRTSVYGGYTNADYDMSGFANPDTEVDIWAIGLRHKF